jgi:DNA-binding beta-propeller fold protein YncE
VHQVQPLQEIRQASLLHKLNSPGSLCIVGHDHEQAEVLVCNNYSHRISRHLLPLRAGFSLPLNSILLHEGLQIPDGIAISPDKSWLAVSNHNTRSVLMFDRRTNLRPSTVADGNLLDSGYPHGIRFSCDGRRLYVADAGAPFVHVYHRSETGWSGDHKPVASLVVLSEDRFLKGHVNPQEGGPKGIDLTSEGDLLAITCEEQPLAFFHLPVLEFQR